jgi:hypothetical protein
VTCGTCHFACDCREAQLKAQLAAKARRIEELEQALRAANLLTVGDYHNEAQRKLVRDKIDRALKGPQDTKGESVDG